MTQRVQDRNIQIAAGETALQLRALVPPSRGLGSIPSTYTVAHSCLLPQFQGSDALF